MRKTSFKADVEDQVQLNIQSQLPSPRECASPARSQRRGPVGQSDIPAPQVEDCQGAAASQGRKITTATSPGCPGCPPGMLVVPTTPKQRLAGGMATGKDDMATATATVSLMTSPDSAKLAPPARSAHLTSTGLAVLTHSTRGDKLRDTSVWVAGLPCLGAHRPADAPPAAAASSPSYSPAAAAATAAAASAEPVTARGAQGSLANYPRNHHHMDSTTNRQSATNHRRSDGGLLPIRPMVAAAALGPSSSSYITAAVPWSTAAAAAEAAAEAATASPLAGATAAAMAAAAATLEPSASTCRRGSHISSVLESYFPDTGSTVSGAAATATAMSPVTATGVRTRASSAATTISSLGQADAASGGACPCPWSDLTAAAATVAIAAAAGAGAPAVLGGGAAAGAAGFRVCSRGASWTSGDKDDEENAPLLSAYVATMPSAGSAPPNEDARIASKRQRSTSDGIWPTPRSLAHPPSWGPHPAAAAAAAAAAATGTAQDAAGAGAAPTILPFALPQRRLTQQQGPFTHLLQHHPQQAQHHPQQAQQQQQQQQQSRRQSLEAYRLPLVPIGNAGAANGGGAGGAAAVNPATTTAAISPALSERAPASSHRIVPTPTPTPSLTRDVPRIDLSDLSDDDSPSSCSNNTTDDGTSLRLPPLQPLYNNHAKVRCSVDGDPGPRPRQPGHSFFTDSRDEFDCWQQQQQQQQPQNQQPQCPPSTLSRGLPQPWLRNQPPFLQCRSGPAAAESLRGGGGGADAAAGLQLPMSQLRANSCSNAAARSAVTAVAAGGDGHGYCHSPAARRPVAACNLQQQQQQQHEQQQQQQQHQQYYNPRDSPFGEKAPRMRDSPAPGEHAPLATVGTRAAFSLVLAPAESPTSAFAAAFASAALTGPMVAAASNAPLSPLSPRSPAGSNSGAAATASTAPPLAASPPPGPLAGKLQAWPSVLASSSAAAGAAAVLPVLSSPRASTAAAVASASSPQPATEPPPPATPGNESDELFPSFARVPFGGGGPAAVAVAVAAAAAASSAPAPTLQPQPPSYPHPHPPSQPQPQPPSQARHPSPSQLRYPSPPQPQHPSPSQPQSLAAAPVGSDPQLPQGGAIVDTAALPADPATAGSTAAGGAIAAATSSPMTRRRQPVPPPLPPASRSRRGLLLAASEETAVVTP